MARKLTAAQALKLDLQHQFSAKDKTHSVNWKQHTEDCCARVWRPKRFPCLPPLDPYRPMGEDDSYTDRQAEVMAQVLTKAHVDTGHGN